MSVKNIKLDTLELGDVAARLQKAYGFLKLDDQERKQIKTLTPTHTHSIRFDLTANTALANAWRRVALDEVEWPRITCAMHDIVTDDPFCQRMADYIQNRIWLVPTSHCAPQTGYKLKLSVKNTSEQPVIVKSSAITAVAVPQGFQYAQDIDLIQLLPGRAIDAELTIEWGTNRQHASHSNFHSIRYCPLDYNCDEEGTLPPSYSVHPKRYQLGLTCEQFVDPRASAVMIWRTVHSIVSAARDQLQLSVSAPQPYLSALLNVTRLKGGVIRYEFFNQTYTLSNILAWYAYQLDTSITFIHAGDDHPEDQSALVRIVHVEHALLLVKACAAALRDLDAVIAGF